MNQNDDILGRALLDYVNKENFSPLIISGEALEDDEMDVSYYFRKFGKMPKLEQKALALCKGKVLDIGAGAGSHALYLQEQGIEVDAIDVSQGAVEVMKKRGVENCRLKSALELTSEPYDTILLLMNGIGISGTLAKLPELLLHLFSLLKEDGQLIFDSTDLRYLYEEEDGSFVVDLNAAYYGEMTFNYSYKGNKSASFDWLYIDKELLNNLAIDMGLRMEVVFEEDDYHYLVRITKQ